VLHKIQIAAFIAIAAALGSGSCLGKTVRSKSELRAFAKEQACPSTGLYKLPCPGFQIDHVWPLKCAGPDRRENMQWLSIQDHKDKTRAQNHLCRKKAM
jgi:hypothetical protein